MPTQNAPRLCAAVVEILRESSASARVLAVRTGTTLQAMQHHLRQLQRQGVVKHATLGGWRLAK